MADTDWTWLSERGASTGSVLFLSPRANPASTLAPITIGNACLPTTVLLLLLLVQVRLLLEWSHYKIGNADIIQPHTEYTALLSEKQLATHIQT